MSDQQQPVSVQSLVEAIDQRARQAGTEGATTILRGLMGTVAETMASIEARLAGIEQSGLGASQQVSGDQIAEVLQAMNVRLGRLEEAFVRAVEDSSEGTVSISDRVAEVIGAFLDERLPPTGGPTVDGGSAVEPSIGPELSTLIADLQAEIVAAVRAQAALTEGRVRTVIEEAQQTALTETSIRAIVGELKQAPPLTEAGMRSLLAETQKSSLAEAQKSALTEANVRAIVGELKQASPLTEAGVKALLAEVTEKIDGLVAAADDSRVSTIRAVGQAADSLRQSQTPTNERLTAIASSVEQLSKRVSAPVAAAPEGLDRETKARLDRIGSDIERLLRQEQAGRLVQLVETRMGAGLDAVVRRVEALSAEIGSIGATIDEGRKASAKASEAAVAARDGVASTGERVRDQVSRIGALESRVGQIADVVRTTSEQLREVGPSVSSRIERHVESRHSETKAAVESIASAVEAGQRQSVDALRDHVRSESEQITQRVAALSVAIERLREEVEALAEESAQTLGRKASQVGRRLAADLGLRGKKDENDRDRGRELGPGR